VHARGLKLGIYLDAGPATCAGFPGSAGHFSQDAHTVASWGVDLVKLDYCRARPAPAKPIYASFAAALAQSGRRILLNMCVWGYDSPWQWGAGVASTWRTTGDYMAYGAPRNYWKAIVKILDLNADLAPYARPGAFNDPNEMLIGTKLLTMPEERSQLSLWSIMAAPLIAGGDLSTAAPATRQILTNREVIAIDQDPAGIQGTRIAIRAGHQAWLRRLSNGDRALLLLNTGARPAIIEAPATELGLADNQTYVARDLWAHRSRTIRGAIKALLGPHSVAMFRIHT
jgi:alpha-galactosidase